jgi:hypothetical protein
MRTITFRGKSTVDGKWVYGGYVKQGSYNYIQNEHFVNVPVHPQSVGQLLGKKDKKGVPMYQGDRVRFVAVTAARQKEFGATGTIEWDEEDVGFYIANDNERYPHVKFWHAEQIEVTGNQFELLNPGTKP